MLRLFIVSLLLVSSAHAVTQDKWLAYIEGKIPGFVGSLCSSRFLMDCHKVERAGCIAIGKKVGQQCFLEHKPALPAVLEPGDEKAAKMKLRVCISSGVDRALAPKKRKLEKCVNFEAWKKANDIQRGRID